MAYKPKILSVSDGGTGNNSLTDYAVLCGGTSSTGNLQSVASVGSSGQLLTSNGAGALPTFQNASSVGGSCVLNQFQTQTNVTAITFTTAPLNGTTPFLITLQGIVPLTGGSDLLMEVSTDGGSTWKSSGYNTGVNHNAVNSTTLTNSTATANAILGKTLSGISTYNATIWMENLAAGNFGYYHGTATWYDGSVYRFGYLGGNLGYASINGLRFKMSSGNITGNIGVYYLKTS